ncbi:hypothetical protein [Hymenobacter canadensis]|uniref:Uncharacterized protein n=1 Tax=Hymenobacter canadensis TaxID=2999067 RepID=A0ABY7LPM6_9BACT|nr:hypothetical protein [Hymenobacter canadensis]WBA42373.1 hypothetical protein O3303_02175 [Hymenobacter canadensis]
MASYISSIQKAACQVTLLLLAGVVQAQSPSRIAALQTDAQVLELIRPLGWEYKEAVLGDSVGAVYSPYRFTRFAVRGGQTWFRADFDQNGRPDLLVLTRRKEIPFVFCVLDMGHDSLRVVRNFYNAVQRRSPVARVIQQRNQDLLEYADFARSRGSRGQLRNRRTQQLAYVSGGFVDYNPKPAQHHIQRVTYESYSVYHQAVKTRIVVAEDSSHFWQRRTEIRDSTKVTHQQYHTPLHPAQHQQLSVLLNYLDFPRLRNAYDKVYRNHHPHVTLTVEYDNGQRKIIEDLNGMGTTGLRRLYALLYELSMP